MTEDELKFLTHQLIEKAGYDPTLTTEAAEVFANLHPEVMKVFYSQAGLEKLNASIEAWKTTPTGSKFLPIETPKSVGRLTTKEISEQFKSGKLKFQSYY